MDAWFDEMGLGMEDVLDACKKTAGISSPNIRYVDAVLRGRKEQQEGGGEKSSARALLQKVLRSYEQERKQREAEAEERRAAVYAALPRVAEIDRESSALLPAITMAMLGGKRGEGERLQKRYDALLAEREKLLAEAGYQNNYTDIWYACPLCKDSGILDNGEHCVCLRERLAAAGKTL